MKESLKTLLDERLSSYVNKEKIRGELSRYLPSDIAAELFKLEDTCAKEIVVVLLRHRVGGRIGLNLVRTTYLLLPTFLIATVHGYEQLRWTRGRLNFLRFMLNFLKFDISNGYSYKTFNHLISIHQVAEYDLIANDWRLPSLYKHSLVDFFTFICSILSIWPWKSIYFFGIFMIDLIHHFIHFINHTILSAIAGSFDVSPLVPSYIAVHFQSAAHLAINLDYDILQNRMCEASELSYSLFISSIEYLAKALANQTSERFDPDDVDTLRAWLVDL